MSSGKLWEVLGSTEELRRVLESSEELWGAQRKSGELWEALGSSEELWQLWVALESSRSEELRGALGRSSEEF